MQVLMRDSETESSRQGWKLQYSVMGLYNDVTHVLSLLDFVASKRHDVNDDA